MLGPHLVHLPLHLFLHSMQPLIVSLTLPHFRFLFIHNSIMELSRELVVILYLLIHSSLLVCFSLESISLERAYLCFEMFSLVH